MLIGFISFLRVWQTFTWWSADWSGGRGMSDVTTVSR